MKLNRRSQDEIYRCPKSPTCWGILSSVHSVEHSDVGPASPHVNTEAEVLKFDYPLRPRTLR